MGGVVNVAIRFRDGSAVCQERWTNNISHWFRSPKMYEGDEDYVREYVAMTRHNDYIADPYAPGRPEPIRNSEYGLIVWDYMTGYILDNNTYSHPASLDPVQFKTQRELFDELASAGRLRFRMRAFEEGHTGPASDEITPILTLDQAVKMGEFAYEQSRLFSDRRKGFMHYNFEIVTEPMTYLVFPEKAFAGMKRKLVELKFPLTKKDGLNASLPPIPRPRKISEREKIARELFCDYKGNDEDKKFESISYDAVGKFIQDQLSAHADDILNDPKKSLEHSFRGLFG